MPEIKQKAKDTRFGDIWKVETGENGTWVLRHGIHEFDLLFLWVKVTGSATVTPKAFAGKPVVANDPGQTLDATVEADGLVKYDIWHAESVEVTVTGNDDTVLFFFRGAKPRVRN